VCESIKVAIGTVDGRRLTRGHFGDSPLFAIYRLTPEGWELLELRRNTAADLEERRHGDPAKFKAVASLLGDVDVAAAWAMGPNYVRMRDEGRLVPYIVRGRARRSMLVEDALMELAERFSDLCRMVLEKRTRKYKK